MTATSAYAGENNSVIYEYSDGTIEEWTGGTRAWRNNNPGNIRSGRYVDGEGAIGSAGGFGVFPDYDTGYEALTTLLGSRNYRNRTLGEAIARYAPASENDTESYISHVEDSTGDDRDTDMQEIIDAGDLTSVADAIKVVTAQLDKSSDNKVDIIRGLQTGINRTKEKMDVPLKIDGSFGPKSASGLKKALAAHGPAKMTETNALGQFQHKTDQAKKSGDTKRVIKDIATTFDPLLPSKKGQKESTVGLALQTAINETNKELVRIINVLARQNLKKPFACESEGLFVV